VSPVSSKGVRVSLDELLSMRLRARRLARPSTRVRGSHAATHTSRFRGRGVDYVESRAYQPGDDIRLMDWRLTARSGRPHTKVFQEEREQSILLLVDCNASMHFGSRARFKSVQAARTAALVAWAAVHGGDRVGAIGFGPGLKAEIANNLGLKLECGASGGRNLRVHNLLRVGELDVVEQPANIQIRRNDMKAGDRKRESNPDYFAIVI